MKWFQEGDDEDEDDDERKEIQSTRRLPIQGFNSSPAYTSKVGFKPKLRKEERERGREEGRQAFRQ